MRRSRRTIEGEGAVVVVAQPPPRPSVPQLIKKNIVESANCQSNKNTTSLPFSRDDEYYAPRRDRGGRRRRWPMALDPKEDRRGG